jgi:DNA-binding SARP family transcriptional activator
MAAMPSTRALVDTRRGASLSFAPPEPTAPSPAQPAAQSFAQHLAQPIAIRPAPRNLMPPAVGPGSQIPVSVSGSGGLLGAMSEYPVQVEKVQVPPLRDDILARGRLLDWLNVKIHNRIVLLTAEAGYGKTTLLADFARRTRLRVLWFRLDRGDRDWVGFLAYLVAAVRVHQPDFGPMTAALLRETGSSAPPLESVLDTFLRELGDLPPEPAAFVFDDFHLVDDSADIRQIANELVARMPDRMSLVFASRQTPSLRLARLRSLAELAELSSGDLRFDGTETDMFLSAEGPHLDPQLVDELVRKTEGWPASLQLVRAALRAERGDARTLVDSLSGAHGDLYDYLAEEVIGDLPPELQDFLTRASILDPIDPSLASVAADRLASDVARLVDEARRLGLLTRIGRKEGGEARAHPLVREFLQSRLRRSLGHAVVQSMHLRVASRAEQFDWRQASHHFVEAGHPSEAIRVLDESLPRILATGAFHAAAEILDRASAEDGPSRTALVVAARLAQQAGEGFEATLLAERAMALDPLSPSTITTVMAARMTSGDSAGAFAVAHQLESGPDPQGRAIAAAYRLSIETSVDGSIPAAITNLTRLTRDVGHSSSPRYLGVTWSNLALLRKATGDARAALSAADASLTALAGTSAHIDRVSARLVRGWALAHLGDLEAARAEVAEAVRIAPSGQQIEVAGEIGELEFYYGDRTSARTAIEAVGELNGDGRDQALLVRCLLDGQDNDLAKARGDLDGLEVGTPRSTVAFEARRQVSEAYLSWLAKDAEATRLATAAADFARRQGAGLWQDYASVLAAVSDPTANPSRDLQRIGSRHPAVLSMAAEVVVTRLADLSAGAAAIVERESSIRPERWRAVLRTTVAAEDRQARLMAARLLLTVAETEDVALLGRLGRSSRDSDLLSMSRNLARQLAPKVYVSDLGRVRIHVGNRTVDASGVRRKVLALLSFLITKPHYSASREDATENLWPDLDPDDAINSLNQTVYFLRRVFEPSFREELSPGYVHQDGETIWLDPELVDSASSRCRRLIAALPHAPAIADGLAVLGIYEAPFALDFAYEEWAGRFRDPLHAAVLRVLEHSMHRSMDGSDLRAAIALAEQSLALEPDADEIQATLIHLYRLTGAHAAAAEQYARYAESLTALGVEVPAISQVGTRH